MDTYDFDSLLKSGEKKEIPMAIAIGVFDGVHLGHKRIFETLKNECLKDSTLESMCITFNTNPKNISQGALDTLRLRKEYVESFSINSFTIIDFSENFSKISACGFIKSLLSLAKVKVLVLGSDFKCGNPKESATGDEMVKIFASFGANVKLNKVDFVLSDSNEKISSTLLRGLIRNGDLESYSRFSGDNYRIDLLTKPSKTGSRIAYSREQISQLLPPPGAYECELMFVDREKVLVNAEITETDLTIECSECSKQIDSLFITRRR